MNRAGKVLLGLGIVATVATTAYVVKKTTERKYVNASRNEDGDTIVEESDDILAKIKKGASKKATEILAWVIIHKDQIDAAATVLGVCATALSIVNAVRDYKQGNEIEERLSDIYDHCSEFEDVWNAHMNNYHRDTSDILNKIEEIIIFLENNAVVTKPSKKKA